MQLWGAVVVAALLGVRVPPVVLVSMAGLGLFAGNVQGWNLEITEDAGRPYATRSTVAWNHTAPIASWRPPWATSDERAGEVDDEETDDETAADQSDDVAAAGTLIDEELVDTEPETESVGRTGSGLEEELAEFVSALPPPGPGQEIGPYLDGWAS